MSDIDPDCPRRQAYRRHMAPILERMSIINPPRVSVLLISMGGMGSGPYLKHQLDWGENVPTMRIPEYGGMEHEYLSSRVLKDTSCVVSNLFAGRRSFDTVFGWWSTSCHLRRYGKVLIRRPRVGWTERQNISRNPHPSTQVAPATLPFVPVLRGGGPRVG